MTEIRRGDFIRASGKVSAINYRDGRVWVEIAKPTIEDHEPARGWLWLWFATVSSGAYSIPLSKGAG